MTAFAPAPAALPRVAPLDPAKHVKYTLGMVLGVDDFDQEFAYLSGRDRWLARDLFGYGTVWGLDVGVELEDRGPRVNVSPGVALTPCGQLVCVTPAQCAYVNDWLDAHGDEVGALLETMPAASPPAPLPLYVVLCYRECATDDVPIPGEPCRTEDTLSAPSRLKDDFRLELRLAPPRQPEEDAVRDFVQWLRLVPVVDGPGSSVDDLLAAVTEAAEAAVESLESPPSSPPSPPAGPLDFLFGIPPPGLTIPAALAGEYFRAAFRLWTTDLRPALRRALPGCECGCARGAGCGCGSSGTCGCGCDGATAGPGEACDDDVVLLATVDMPIFANELVAADSGWTIDESRRPYVLHTRLLQEWLLSGGSPFVDGSPPGSSPPAGSPIATVHAHVVAGNPTATWNPSTRDLDLGIPPGPPGDPAKGIDQVKVKVLAPGTDPTVDSFAGGVLTLGLSTGKQGQNGTAGAGINQVKVNVLAPGSDPTIESFAGGVLTLGLSPGKQGPQGKRGADGLQFVVAAGAFDPEGTAAWSLNKLAARRVGPPGLFYFTFGDDPPFNTDAHYVIKGTAETSFRAPIHTFERVLVDDELARFLQERPEFDVSRGFFARVVAADLKTVPLGFEVEVSDFTKVTE